MFRSKRLRLLFLSLVSLLALGAVAAYAAINIWPSVGASTVDVMRKIIGDQAVALVEDAILKTEDKARQLGYSVSANSTEVQWTGGEITESAPVSSQPSPIRPTPAPTVVVPNITPLPGHTNPTPASADPTLTAPPPPAQAAWLPAPATPLGTRKDEAQWQPFITTNQRVVAYRTYIMPDPLRPYAFAAVIAFDLQNTRLHFLLGKDDPKSDVQVERSGRIPLDDRQAGLLLAAFNGGFKAEHGHFGVMVNGTTLIPARDNIGTIGLYADGSVRMGLLNTDVPVTPDMLAWRQNGPLVIQNGAINPLTDSNDPQDWGYVVSSDTATYRSAIAISQDNRTLYFVVGPDLTLPALAKALAAVPVYQAIQLDINNYWAHFETFAPSGAGLKAIPLLDFMKGIDDQRFLGAYIRDYFYVTAK